MIWWRFLVVTVAFIVVVSTCGGSGETSDDGPINVGNPGSSEGLFAAFEAIGIDIIDGPEAGSGDRLELWSYQVENLEREVDAGGGYFGRQLDAIAGAPGGMPFSFLIAGWLSSAPTPAAEAAVDLMGEQDWSRAPALVFPTAVLVLFVSDAIDAGADGESSAMVMGQLASLAQGGICSTLAGWVNSALDFIFDALKINTDDEGFLGWLATVWNAAVDLARAVVVGLIELLTAPIVNAIADALAVVGTLNMVASLLQPWSLEVTPSSAQTRFSVGGGGDIEEEFVVKVDTNIDFEWPPTVEDCASVAGLDLPDPSSAEDSGVAWVTGGLPSLGVVTRKRSLVDVDNEARLEWVTGHEESDKGEAVSGTVSATATVVSNQVEELQAMLAHLISGQIPIAPFGAIVGEIFSALTRPIFAMLAQLVQVDGTASVSVTYHREEEPPEVTEPGDCLLGTWAVNNEDVLNLHGANLGEVAVEVFAEGSVIAEFDEDGTVTYAFRGWKVGNTTFTKAAIEEFANLTGFVSTESNGSARGTWRIENGLLVLIVGDFDTTVVQKVVSPELEIDSTIDALPDLARVYVIPNGATRFICNGDLHAVEWRDGIGIRWARRF